MKEKPRKKNRERKTEETNTSHQLATRIDKRRSRTPAFGECLLKKVEGLSEGKGTVTAQFKAQMIYELRHDFKVVDLIRVAAIPRSTYY